jgi:cytochrome c556
MAMRSPRFSLLALALLAACKPSAAPAPPQAAALSIQELMVTMVDPSAGALWESVSSETTATGIKEHQPGTDAEWQAVRRHALALLEGARLLGADGRAVAKPGKALEDAHVAGILTAPEIERKIAATGQEFKARARELGESAEAALAAIDARDPARLLAAGGKIDQACERCHMAYWYPNAAQPAAKWPAALKRN